MLTKPSPMYTQLFVEPNRMRGSRQILPGKKLQGVATTSSIVTAYINTIQWCQTVHGEICTWLARCRILLKFSMVDFTGILQSYLTDTGVIVPLPQRPAKPGPYFWDMYCIPCKSYWWKHAIWTNAGASTIKLVCHPPTRRPDTFTVTRILHVYFLCIKS